MRNALSFTWYECFSRKSKEWKTYRCGLVLSSETRRSKFHVSIIWHTTRKITPKSVPHVQHDYLPHSINQIIDLWCCRCHSRRRFLSLMTSATVFLRTFCTPGTCIYNFDTFDWRQLWNNEAKWRKFACQLNLLIIVSHFRFVTPSKTILIAPIIAIVVLQSLQSLRSYGNQS